MESFTWWFVATTLFLFGIGWVIVDVLHTEVPKPKDVDARDWDWTNSVTDILGYLSVIAAWVLSSAMAAAAYMAFQS